MVDVLSCRTTERNSFPQHTSKNDQRFLDRPLLCDDVIDPIRDLKVTHVGQFGASIQEPLSTIKVVQKNRFGERCAAVNILYFKICTRCNKELGDGNT